MEELTKLLDWFERNRSVLRFSCHTTSSKGQVQDITDWLSKLSFAIEKDFPFCAKRLFDLKNKLFLDGNIINVAIYGRIAESLLFLKDAIENKEIGVWKYIHPNLADDVKKRFQQGFYSDAVFAATKILMLRLKEIYRNCSTEVYDIDGAALIEKLLPREAPKILFSELETRSGQNIQKGYEHLFKGWIHAIRNTKAHDSTNVMTEEEAFRELIFISSLMEALDKSEIKNSRDEKADNLL